MDIREVFARNLRRYRRAARLSQEELAHRSDIDRTYISSLERSVYAASIDVVDRLAQPSKYRLQTSSSDAGKKGDERRVTGRRSDRCARLASATRKAGRRIVASREPEIREDAKR